jgi:hypothetical protein
MTPQKVTENITLAKVHQWVTLTIIPGMLGIILWFVLLIYNDYKNWRNETDVFKQGQVKRDYEQDIQINELGHRVEAVNSRIK